LRNRLSYYSVLLLVGLAVVSALLFTMNPFNGPPASASPAQRGASVTTSSSVGGNGPLISNSPSATAPGGNGFGFGLQPGGTSGGHHHHSDGLPGIAGTGGNATATTTTTTGTIYSQDE
jgi:hypothetical protein